ncbi:MAG: hypothetical protein ACPL1A_10065 [Candidatus Kapaibacteriota bacterium]
MKWFIFLILMFLFSTVSISYSLDKIDFENTTIKIIRKEIEIKPNVYRVCNFQIRIPKTHIQNNTLLNKKIFIQKGDLCEIPLYSYEKIKGVANLYSCCGNIIKSVEINLNEGDNKLIFETIDLNKGFYFLFVENKNIILEKQMLFIK